MKVMKKYIVIFFIVLTWIGCTNFPIDEDGLLITERSECYVDYQTVRHGAAVIDTMKQTIHVEVLYGTDLKNLYPQFSLVTDAKLEPKIEGKVDFSDLANPKQYTVISGNRKVRKIYTVYVSVQQK